MWIWLVKDVEGSGRFFFADCSSRSRVVCSELILLSAWIRAINAFKNRVRAEWLDHCRGLVRSCSFQFHPIPLDRNQKLQMATSNCFHLRQMWNQKFLQASLPLPTSPKSVVSREVAELLVRFNKVCIYHRRKGALGFQQVISKNDALKSCYFKLPVLLFMTSYTTPSNVEFA